MRVRDDLPEDPWYEWVVRWRIYRRDAKGRLHREPRSRTFRMSSEGTVKSQKLYETLSAAAKPGSGIGHVVRTVQERTTPKAPVGFKQPKQPGNRAARRAHLQQQAADCTTTTTGGATA